MSLVHNERIKTRATYYNGLAAAIMTAGVFVPLINAFNGNSSITIYSFATLVICFFTSRALHSVAERTMKGLIDDI